MRAEYFPGSDYRINGNFGRPQIYPVLQCSFFTSFAVVISCCGSIVTNIVNDGHIMTI